MLEKVFIYVSIGVSIMVVVMVIKLYSYSGKKKKLDEQINYLQVYKNVLENNDQEIIEFENQITEMLDKIKNDKSSSGLSEDIGQPFDEVAMITSICHLKYNALKGLLIDKYYRSFEKRIDFVVTIRSNFHEVDLDEILLCRILGILLDNAIEAASYLQQPYVQVMFFDDLDEDCKIIKISNNYMKNYKDIRRQNEPDRKGGLGLKSLANLLDTQEIFTLETEIDKTAYHQTIRIEC